MLFFPFYTNEATVDTFKWFEKGEEARGVLHLDNLSKLNFYVHAICVLFEYK